MGKLSLSSDMLAQIAHVGWGIVIVWGLRICGISLVWAYLSAFLFASGKEAIFDVLFEDHATQGSGLRDWAYWLVGIGMASLISAGTGKP